MVKRVVTGQTVNINGNIYECIASSYYRRNGKEILVFQSKSQALPKKDRVSGETSKDLLAELKNITIQDLKTFVEDSKKKGIFIPISSIQYIATQYIGFTNQDLGVFYKVSSKVIARNTLRVRGSQKLISKADKIALSLGYWKSKQNKKRGVGR